MDETRERIRRKHEKRKKRNEMRGPVRGGGKRMKLHVNRTHLLTTTARKKRTQRTFVCLVFSQKEKHISTRRAHRARIALKKKGRERKREELEDRTSVRTELNCRCRC